MVNCFITKVVERGEINTYLTGVERSFQMEALSRVKELFPNLAGISSGVIVALFDLGYP